MDGGGEILGRAVKKKNVEPVYSKFVFFFFYVKLTPTTLHNNRLLSPLSWIEYDSISIP